MTSKRRMGWLGAALCTTLLCAGCLGPSAATGRLWKWNAELDGKWGNEGAFLLLLPVYALFSVGDMLIFNSYYWWTGDHLVDPPSADEEHTFGVRVAEPELEAVKEVQ